MPRINPGVFYARALDRRLMCEARLLRAFHAWEKARRDLARAEVRLDESEVAAQGARASGLEN